MRTCERLLEEHFQKERNNNNNNDLSLIMLPEMCFTGYTFHDKDDVSEFVEFDQDDEVQETKDFLIKLANKYDCLVCAGYVRGCLKNDDAGNDNGDNDNNDEFLFYNAMQIVNKREVLARVNKNHLYILDETWADESSEGFVSRNLVIRGKSCDGSINEFRVKTQFGICMDINPYKFQKPWKDYEFANAILKSKSSLTLFSSAWTNAHPDDSNKDVIPKEEETWNYWFSRLAPIFEKENDENDDDDDVVTNRAFVFANRLGVEEGIHFVGSSIAFEHSSKNSENIAIKGSLTNNKEGVLVTEVWCEGVLT
jgi:protein N-terminal amidase